MKTACDAAFIPYILFVLLTLTIDASPIALGDTSTLGTQSQPSVEPSWCHGLAVPISNARTPLTQSATGEILVRMGVLRNIAETYRNQLLNQIHMSWSVIEYLGPMILTPLGIQEQGTSAAHRMTAQSPGTPSTRTVTDVLVDTTRSLADLEQCLRNLRDAPNSDVIETSLVSELNTLLCQTEVVGGAVGKATVTMTTQKENQLNLMKQHPLSNTFGQIFLVSSLETVLDGAVSDINAI